MVTHINLPTMIDNYMNYMTFIKSSSPLTIKHYLIDLQQAFPVEGGQKGKSKAWTEQELLNSARQAFHKWSHLSLASRNRKAATLKSFFSWAFDQQHIQQNLGLQISCPKVPQKIPHFISVDEALAILKAFDQQEIKSKLLRQKVLFLLIYGGGLRVSEACNLKWTDVHFQQKTLRVLGKGQKERLIALPTLTFSVLKSWQKTCTFDYYVFGDKPINPRTAYEMIRNCGIMAGLLKPLHPHALRHSFATHLLTSGANLRTLQELLGHESLQATEKYTHLGIDQLARTMERLHPLGKGK